MFYFWLRPGRALITLCFTQRCPDRAGSFPPSHPNALSILRSTSTSETGPRGSGEVESAGQRFAAGKTPRTSQCLFPANRHQHGSTRPPCSWHNPPYCCFLPEQQGHLFWRLCGRITCNIGTSTSLFSQTRVRPTHVLFRCLPDHTRDMPLPFCGELPRL
jgi:hypothetical protein